VAAEQRGARGGLGVGGRGGRRARRRSTRGAREGLTLRSLLEGSNLALTASSPSAESGHCRSSPGRWGSASGGGGQEARQLCAAGRR